MDDITLNVLNLFSNLVINTPYTGRFIMFSVITNIYNKKPNNLT
jgi:hypothetical protein